MDMLKKFFPFSFTPKKELKALIVMIVLFVVADIVCGVVFGLLGRIPLVGIVFRILGWVIGIYLLVSLVLAVLDYLKLLK